MKIWKKLAQRKWAPYTIASCSAVLLYVALTHIDLFLNGLSNVYRLIMPVFSGLIIAYILDPFVMFFQRNLLKRMKSQKLARNISILLTIVLLILLLVLLLVALIPQIGNSVVNLVRNFDGYAASLLGLMADVNERLSKMNIDVSNLREAGDNIIRKISSGLSNNMDQIIGTSYNIGQGVMNMIIAFILAVYFLTDKMRLQANTKKLIRLITKEKQYKSLADFYRRCNQILLRYMACDILEGVIVGCTNFLFMLILQMPYAILISVIVGITNLAPTFGPLVGGVIGGLILLLVNPWYALWFLIFTVVLQTVDGYVIKPKLFGDTLGVSAIWILIAIVIGGKLFGVVGILLAIPFAAICDYIFQNVLWAKLEKEEALERAQEEGKSEGEE